MIPAISQACTLQSSFEKDLEDYASASCPTCEIWLGKLETYLDSHSIDDAKSLMDQHGVAAPVASYQGGLFEPQEEASAQHWRHFEKRLETCQGLGIKTLVIAGDLALVGSDAELDRIRGALRRAADLAAEKERRLAFEFQARAGFANNLETAAALVTEVDSPALGLCLDAFHFHVGPSMSEDLGVLSPRNLFHVQLCDIAGTPREFASDADRIVAGDGDIALEGIVAMLKQIGYEGCVSLEMMNPQLWQIPPLQVAEIGMTALRRLLGLAEMD